MMRPVVYWYGVEYRGILYPDALGGMGTYHPYIPLITTSVISSLLRIGSYPTRAAMMKEHPELESYNHVQLEDDPAITEIHLRLGNK